MRLFITSYQKSGTHQIMPMFLVHGTDGRPLPMVEDKSYNSMSALPSRYSPLRFNLGGKEATIKALTEFRKGSQQAFGHVAYQKEYAQVFVDVLTKVLFNIRDPRDIIISEWENILRFYREERPVIPFLDLLDKEEGRRVSQKDDPISELILFASLRWPKWLGWLEHDFVLPVKYEEIRQTPFNAIDRMIEWLEPYSCPDRETMKEQAIPSLNNPTFRRGCPGEWKDRFTKKHIQLSEDLLGNIITKLGYDV